MLVADTVGRNRRKKMKIPRRMTAKRYGVHPRTVNRWEADLRLGFPPSITVNGRIYDDVAELDAWDAECAAAGRTTQTPPAAGPRHDRQATDTVTAMGGRPVSPAPAPAPKSTAAPRPPPPRKRIQPSKVQPARAATEA
jgi:hypothetical protein